MEWSTHALSGITAGYVITGDWIGALVGGIASVVPDIDEPKSKFGKPLFLISLPLNQIIGHRTLTHSVLFAVIVGAIISLLVVPQLGIVAAVGIMIHVVGDMLTGKVQILFPFKIKLGISVSRFSYILIDRVTRLSLVVLIGITAYRELSLMF